MNKPVLRVVNGQSERKLVDLADDDLMLLAKAGKQEAFETLVKRHQRLVLALACRYFGNPSTGRDVTQDVFLSLWAERDRYRARGRFRSYLVSITFHRCHYIARQAKSHGRKMNNLQRDIQAQASDEEPSFDVLVEAERARLVRQKLSELPEKMRNVLILRFTHEMTLDEIAELTGAPLGTVKSHVFRGLKRLNRLLAKES